MGIPKSHHAIVRQVQSAIQDFLHDASDLDPITDVLLREEMIINHLAQARTTRSGLAQSLPSSRD